MANTPRVPIRSSPIIEAVNDIVQPANSRTGRPTLSRGVFSSYPFMSPKYARHQRNRHHEFEDTMARMFMKVEGVLYDEFLNSLEDAETRRIAEVLAGDEDRKGGQGYIDFLLQNATHNFDEKVQIAETLSDSYVAFFFGHAPPVFQYQGTLMNTFQDDWTMSMFRVFKDLCRGTQLAKRNLVLRLRYDSMIVTGAMTNFSWSLKAGQETACPFSFNLLVKNIQVLYGGLAPPTHFGTAGTFTPPSFEIDGTASQGAASQTYIGTPPGAPSGVAVATQAAQQQYVLETGVSDTTGDPNEVNAAGYDATGTQVATVMPTKWELEQAYAAAAAGAGSRR